MPNLSGRGVPENVLQGAPGNHREGEGRYGLVLVGAENADDLVDEVAAREDVVEVDLGEAELVVLLVLLHPARQQGGTSRQRQDPGRTIGIATSSQMGSLTCR